jgi:hypothetical protein
VMYIKSQDIIKATKLAFIPQICKKLVFNTNISLMFLFASPYFRLSIRLFAAFLTAISITHCRLFNFTDRANTLSPARFKITANRAKLRFPCSDIIRPNNKFFPAMLANKCFALHTVFCNWGNWLKHTSAFLTLFWFIVYHNCIVPYCSMLVKQISPEYCKIAENRLRDTEENLFKVSPCPANMTQPLCGQ